MQKCKDTHGDNVAAMNMWSSASTPSGYWVVLLYDPSRNRHISFQSSQQASDQDNCLFVQFHVSVSTRLMDHILEWLSLVRLFRNVAVHSENRGQNMSESWTLALLRTLCSALPSDVPLVRVLLFMKQNPLLHSEYICSIRQLERKDSTLHVNVNGNMLTYWQLRGGAHYYFNQPLRNGCY
jgi:hypothetical protein